MPLDCVGGGRPRQWSMVSLVLGKKLEMTVVKNELSGTYITPV
jgi:hypothetical protein